MAPQIKNNEPDSLWHKYVKLLSSRKMHQFIGWRIFSSISSIARCPRPCRHSTRVYKAAIPGRLTGSVMPFIYSKWKQNPTPPFRHWTWIIWLVNVGVVWLFLTASVMEILPFMTRNSRQVSCKPVISTTEEVIRQKSNLARKKEKERKTKKKRKKITFQLDHFSDLICCVVRW